VFGFKRKSLVTPLMPDADVGGAASPAAAGAASVDALAIVQRMSGQVSQIGRDAAETRGALEDAQHIAVRQIESLSNLSQQLTEVLASQGAIGAATGASLEAVARARQVVSEVAAEVAEIVGVLHQVSAAASDITQIALQTRLVAFNASVEAKRAGEAGRGFGVVADAVKDLSERVERSSKVIMSTLGQLDSRIETFSKEIRIAGPGEPPGSLQRTFGDVEAQVQRIDSAAHTSAATCADVNDKTRALGDEMQAAMIGMDAAMGCSDRFLGLSERMIDDMAGCGVLTDDTPYIEAAQDAAARLSQLLEQAVAGGQISLADLFDEQYQPIAGTEPQQYMTRFVALTDRLFPAVQEQKLAFSPQIVFCAACDRNGYIPTHNRKYCQPQRGNLVWDTAHSRYRRKYTDRTGLASARNTRPFLLQTYRRDMGGGQFVLLKEASAPITVAGRHWGGVRFAYKF
jgi:methyl-accepting chemotaxis protein